jgi:hypothetical protein
LLGLEWSPYLRRHSYQLASGEASNKVVV